MGWLLGRAHLGCRTALLVLHVMVQKWSERQENHTEVEHEQCQATYYPKAPVCNHILSLNISALPPLTHRTHECFFSLLYHVVSVFLCSDHQGNPAPWVCKALEPWAPRYVICVICSLLQEVPGLETLPVSTRYLELALITNKELVRARCHRCGALLCPLCCAVLEALNTSFANRASQCPTVFREEPIIDVQQIQELL